MEARRAIDIMVIGAYAKVQPWPDHKREFHVSHNPCQAFLLISFDTPRCSCWLMAWNSWRKSRSSAAAYMNRLYSIPLEAFADTVASFGSSMRYIVDMDDEEQAARMVNMKKMRQFLGPFVSKGHIEEGEDTLAIVEVLDHWEAMFKMEKPYRPFLPRYAHRTKQTGRRCIGFYPRSARKTRKSPDEQDQGDQQPRKKARKEVRPVSAPKSSLSAPKPISRPSVRHLAKMFRSATFLQT